VRAGDGQGDIRQRRPRWAWSTSSPCGTTLPTAPLTPIFYGMFERKRLESVGWSQDAHTVLLDVAPQSVLEVTGRTMQPRPLSSPASPSCDRASRRSENNWDLGIRTDWGRARAHRRSRAAARSEPRAGESPRSEVRACTSTRAAGERRTERGEEPLDAVPSHGRVHVGAGCQARESRARRRARSTQAGSKTASLRADGCPCRSWAAQPKRCFVTGSSLSDNRRPPCTAATRSPRAWSAAPPPGAAMRTSRRASTTRRGFPRWPTGRRRDGRARSKPCGRRCHSYAAAEFRPRS